MAEGQQAQLQLLHAKLVEIRNSSQKHEVLHKLTPADDIEVFLCTYDRTATRLGWPEQEWVARLAPCLTGEP